MLSHAGRLTLIKSVIMSLPVYFMSIATLSRATMDQINQVMRKFLWEKLGQNRYMSLIAWDKVCRATEEGGLGIRDISAFNESLMLKLVWNLAANTKKVWVDIMRAKYFSRGGFRGIQSCTRASKVWKEVQRLKEFFRESTRWQIGEGTEIRVVNQPWFAEWTVQRITTNVQRDTTVAEVWAKQDGAWKEDVLTRLLGQQAMSNIQASVRGPRENAFLPDRLIWTPAANGKYTAKEGYVTLAVQRQRVISYHGDQKIIWKEMWS